MNDVDFRLVAPAPASENLMIYLDAEGHVWARNPATGIARHLTGKSPPAEDYLLIDGSRAMTGLLILAALSPTELYHATPKTYVDLANADLKSYVDLADTDLQAQIDLLVAGQVFVGSYDAAADWAIFTGASGLPQGPLPLATGFVSGAYLIVTDPGTGIGNAPPEVFNVGDRIFSDGTDWQAVHVAPTQATASVIALLPEVNQWTDVQEAIEALWTGKVNKAGDVMSGALYLPSTMPLDPDQAVIKAYVDGAFGRCVLKSGDNMTGPINWGTAGVNPPTVGTRSIGTKLVLFGNLAANTYEFALGIEPGSLWFSVTDTSNLVRFYFGSGAARHVFSNNALSLPADPTAGLHAATKQYVDARDALQVTKTGDSMTGDLVVTGSRSIVLNKSDNASGNSGLFGVRDAAGRWGWQIYGSFTGGYVSANPECQLRMYVMVGGWGFHQFMNTTVNSPVQTQWEGALNAPAFNVTSDRRLKTDITPVDPAEAQAIFDAVNPVRFKRTNYLEEPDKMFWGLLADDIAPIAPEIVNKVDEGILSYDLGAALTIVVTQLKEAQKKDHQQESAIREAQEQITLLKAQAGEGARQASQQAERIALLSNQITLLAERVAILQDQLTDLSERFSNKVIADMEAQLARIREGFKAPSQRRTQPQLPEKS